MAGTKGTYEDTDLYPYGIDGTPAARMKNAGRNPKRGFAGLPAEHRNAYYRGGFDTQQQFIKENRANNFITDDDVKVLTERSQKSRRTTRPITAANEANRRAGGGVEGAVAGARAWLNTEGPISQAFREATEQAGQLSGKVKRGWAVGGEVAKGMAPRPIGAGFLDRSSYTVNSTPAASPAAQSYADAANASKPGDVPKYEEPVKALLAAGGKPNDPPNTAPTPGTTGYRQEMPDPMGTDNRTRMTVPGKGFMEIQRGSGVDDASLFRGARGGNILVGARTDAEAARNLQARAEQDQAASVVAQQSNRAVESLRDNRAAKMGISREQLDASEGYARPDMPMPPAERIQQATKRFAESQMTDGDKAMMSGQLEIARAQIEEQRAQEAAQGNLEATRLAQIGGARREALQQQGLDRRTSAESAEKDYSAGAEYYTKLTSSDGKNPPMISPAEWGEALASLDNNETAQALQIPPETIQRWKSGKMRQSEAQWLAQNIMAWKRQQRGTIMGFFRGQPSLQDVMIPQ